MRMLLAGKKNRPISQLEALNRSIAQLRREAEQLEELLPGTSSVDGGWTPSYQSVQSLRGSLVKEELARKRDDLGALTTRVGELEAKSQRRTSKAKTDQERATGAESGRRNWRSRSGATLGRGTRAAFAGVIGAAVLALGAGGFLAETVLVAHEESTAITAPPVAVELFPPMSVTAAGHEGETFYTARIEFQYVSGQVVLSGPSGSFWVDDGMTIAVTRPDRTTSTWTHRFNVQCERNAPIAAEDLTRYFSPGQNLVSVSLYDTCGGSRGTSGPIFLSTYDQVGASSSVGGPRAGA